MRDAARLSALAFLLASGLATPARAVPAFTPDPGVRLSSASFQSAQVAPSGGADYPLRVYYVYASTTIMSATSADGSAFVNEGGVRVSSTVGPGPALDVAISSITGCSVLKTAAGQFRMAYSVVGTTGTYRIYTAISNDGLAWAAETGTAVNLPNTFAGFPTLLNVGAPNWLMYYIQDSAGGNTPASYRIFVSTSSNEGRNWSTGVSVGLNQQASQVFATRRTDNLMRLFFPQLAVGTSSNTTILSALSSDANGTAFALEAGVRASTTTPSTLSAPMVLRSTDTAPAAGFRWRLYYTLRDPYISVDSETVVSALTEKPDPESIAPGVQFAGGTAVQSTITGEIFSALGGASGLAAYLQQAGQANLVGAGLARTDDQHFTATFPTQGATPGYYDLVVTNASGQQTTLTSAVLLDFQGGSAVLTDNLIRPRQGTKTKITVTIFTQGRVTVKIFDALGRLLSTIADKSVPAGQYDFFWDGTTSSGRTVASGVYGVETRGPKLNVVNKIVVIK